MSTLPFPVVALFLLTTVLALGAFTLAVRGSKVALALSVAWICAQSAIALSGFYLSTKTLPPHFFLAPVPPLLLIAMLSLTAGGRPFIEGMSLKWSVLLHTVRIPVEITLYLLFLHKQVPAQMIFEGGNVDILAGLSAPLMWWAFRRGTIGSRGLIVWNSLALLSVLNALVRALLSAPFRFQQFAFDQPTTAILTFPFILLPAFIVPAVILCHLAIFKMLVPSDRRSASGRRRIPR